MPWDEQQWNTALLETTKRLIALRKAHPALRSADYRRIDTGVDGTMVTMFSRHADDETIVVAVNAGDEDETVRPGTEFGTGLRPIWGEGSAADGAFSVPGRSAVIWQVG
jgi:glycosidase